MKNLRNLTIKDEWLRYCRLLLDLGMQDAARDLYRVITHYAYYNERDGRLIENSRYDVKLLFNTIMHEIDNDAIRPLQLIDLANDNKGEEE